MSKDDDTTLRRNGPPPAAGMTDTDRALGGRRRGFPLGVPIEQQLGDDEIEHDDVDITSPIDLLERPLRAETEIQVARRLRSDSTDPAMTRLTEFVGKLAHRLNRQERRERSNNQERANQLLELLDRVPGEAADKIRAELAALAKDFGAQIDAHDDDIKDLKRSNSIASRIVWGALATALAALVYLGNLIWARSANETTMEWRVKALEEIVRHRPDIPKDQP